MKKDDKKYTFSDIVDFFLMIGGLGLGGIFLLMILFQPRFMIPKPLLLIDLLLLALGSIGSTRMLLRQKQNEIDELEELLPPTAQNRLQSFAQTPISQVSNTNIRNIAIEGDLEVRFLEALLHKKGRISLVEAVVLVRESIDKLLPIIERLQAKGIIGTEIEENGQIVYVSI